MRRGGDACVALVLIPRAPAPSCHGDASVPTPPNSTPAFTGRYFAMSLRKPLRTRRGGGRVVRGRDACVALAGGGKRAQEQDEGDASVPTPRPHLSRPYECDDLPPKSLPVKAPPPPLPIRSSFLLN